MPMTKLLLFCVLGLIFSCAKTDEQLQDSAIREAQYHLTNMDCSKALEVLDDIGQDKDDPDYVAVYASSIACQAGYTDIEMALDNLANITTTTGGLLTSFAAFNTSNETVADAVTYSKIVEAINYILEANGGTQPDTDERIAKYGNGRGNDLSMQALLMITVAIGKYFAFYGNTDSAGDKGQGTIVGGDKCIAYYGDLGASADTYLIGTSPGGCNSANAAHDDLDPASTATATIKTRMCEGIILFNNLFEILSNIDLSSNDSLGNVGEVSTVVNDLFSAAQILEAAQAWGGTAVSTIKSITSQSVCEQQDILDLERYFLAMFESNLP